MGVCYGTKKNVGLVNEFIYRTFRFIIHAYTFKYNNTINLFFIKAKLKHKKIKNRFKADAHWLLMASNVRIKGIPLPHQN